MPDSNPGDSDWICLGWGLESHCSFKFPRWCWCIVRLRTCIRWSLISLIDLKSWICATESLGLETGNFLWNSMGFQSQKYRRLNYMIDLKSWICATESLGLETGNFLWKSMEFQSQKYRRLNEGEREREREKGICLSGHIMWSNVNFKHQIWYSMRTGQCLCMRQSSFSLNWYKKVS